MNDVVADISVVIPAWNAERWIRRAIDSVLSQTLPPRELIVVDDGSEDATAEIVAGYGGGVRLLSQSNRGLSAARNAGIDASCGEWVAFLDADDYWLPEKLAQQWELIEKDRTLGFVSCAARLEYEDGASAGCWECMGEEEQKDVLGSLFRRHAAIAGSGSAVVARRNLLLQLGGFDVSLEALEDIDMWMRLAGRGGYACVNETLTVIRRRRGSMSGNLDVMKRSAMEVMKKNRDLVANRGDGFWRRCYASMLTDYAKWEIRSGRRMRAVVTLLQAGILSPLHNGRLVAGLLIAAMNGRVLDENGR